VQDLKGSWKIPNQAGGTSQEKSKAVSAGRGNAINVKRRKRSTSGPTKSAARKRNVGRRKGVSRMEPKQEKGNPGEKKKGGKDMKWGGGGGGQTEPRQELSKTG